MKRPLTSLVAATLMVFTSPHGRVCAHAPAGQARQQQQSPEADEAARLSREVGELYGAGKYAEALPLAERVVALSEKALPVDEDAAATASANLAAILVGMEKFDRAAAAYERALALRERRSGGDHADTNQIREALAAVLFRSGGRARAVQLLEQAIASRERTHGAEHESVLRALANLAYLHLAARDAADRDAAYKRLLDVAERTPGELPKEVSVVLSRYVCGGAAHPDASPAMKAILKRIQGLREARLALGPPRGVVDGGVINGKAISKPAPSYPMEAKRRFVQGTVVIRITVNEDGRVIEAEPMCGPQELLAASAQAARNARFTPTILGGQPVKVTGTITYNFKLN